MYGQIDARRGGPQTGVRRATEMRGSGPIPRGRWRDRGLSKMKSSKSSMGPGSNSLPEGDALTLPKQCFHPESAPAGWRRARPACRRGDNPL